MSSSYRQLELEIDRSREVKANILIVSLPGLGLNHYLKDYLAEPRNEGVIRIVSDSQKLGLYNVGIWSRSWGSKALEVFDGYLRQAQVDQKFAFGVTRPWLLDEDEFKESYLSSHIYKTVYVTVFNREDVVEIIKNRNGSILDLADKIYELSGGIPQLVKYLVVSYDETHLDEGKLRSDENLRNMLALMAESVKKCRLEVLKKTGVANNEGEIKSKLLRETLTYKTVSAFEIEVGFDLTLKIDGLKTGERVTLQEKRILEKMLSKNGRVTKEEVSDIKWGEGKYDEYSDQAINKTMRRLSLKLTGYKISTITKVGYMLEKDDYN